MPCETGGEVSRIATVVSAWHSFKGVQVLGFIMCIHEIFGSEGFAAARMLARCALTVDRFDVPEQAGFETVHLAAAMVLAG